MGRKVIYRFFTSGKGLDFFALHNSVLSLTILPRKMNTQSYFRIAVLLILLSGVFLNTVQAQFQKQHTPSIQSLQTFPEIPDQIQVGDCTLTSVGKIDDCVDETRETVQLDYYLKRVVANEMSATWGDFDAFSTGNNNEGMNALMAQAVAARSYAINWINDEGNNHSEYGPIICYNPNCQNYGNLGSDLHPEDLLPYSDPVYNNAEDAVELTKNYVLVDGRQGYGGVAPAFYAASTNSLNGNKDPGSQYCYEVVSSQDDGWTGDPDFSEGSGEYFHDEGGFPCHEDDVLSTSGAPLNLDPNDGYPRFGHGAGMSQTGALRWSIGTMWNPSGQVYTHIDQSRPTTGYANPSDIGGNISNFTSAYLKDWRQILMHYYVYPFVGFQSNPGLDARLYQLTVVDLSSSPGSTVSIEPERWEGTEITIPKNVTANIPNPTGSDQLILADDESDRPSFLIVEEGADLTIDAEVVIEGNGAELTVRSDGLSANITLSNDVTITADGACLQASGNNATVTIAAGKRVTFEDGGFLSNQGGTFVLKDNALIIIKSTAGEPEIQAGSTFLMGQNAQIVFERPVSMTGNLSNPIRFERLDPSKAWKELTLKADGNYFDHVVFDGGTKTVEILSRDNEFHWSRFKNGWRGISSGYTSTWARSSFYLYNSIVEDNSTVGIVAYHADPEIRSVTVRNSGQAGLWLYDSAISSNKFRNNKVENSGVITTSRNGVELAWGGSLVIIDDNVSRIANNVNHEIQVSSGASALSLGMHTLGLFGDNAVYDTGDNISWEKYIYNNNSNITVDAQDVYWNGTPTSSDFYGSVNYGYHLSSEPNPYPGAWEVKVPSSVQNTATDPVIEIASSTDALSPRFEIESTQDPWPIVRGRMAELRSALRDHPLDLGNSAKIQELFTLQMADAKDSLGEKSANFAEIAKILNLSDKPNLGLDDVQRSALKKAGNLAKLLTIKNALYDENYAQASALIRRFEGSFDEPAQRLDLLQAKIALLEREGKIQEALGLLAEAKKIAPEQNDLEMLESMLRDQTGDVNYQSLSELPEPVELDSELSEKAHAFTLGDAYPNPFNPSTTIPFSLSEQARVNIEVFDLAGRQIRTLADAEYTAGSYSVVFNGAGLASGIYIVRTQVADQSGKNYVLTTRLSLLK